MTPVRETEEEKGKEEETMEERDGGRERRILFLVRYAGVSKVGGISISSPNLNGGKVNPPSHSPSFPGFNYPGGGIRF